VRGLVNQEERQQVSYPAALHCIFCGARGLFMDCLTRNTAARIRVSGAFWVFIGHTVYERGRRERGGGEREREKEREGGEGKGGMERRRE